MNPAQEEARGKPCRCISHEFLRAASVDPGRIAVVHAPGGLRICRERREASRREDDPTGDDEERLLEGSRERAFPPVYRGDVCFTYGEVLLAVESLSRRIRRVFDGGDDPGLVRPKGYIYREGGPEIQISEPLGASRRMPQVVGIHIAPSVEYIVAVLSILRCGEAFLPLDPLWPRERLLSIAARSRTELIIKCETSFCTDRSRRSIETDWSEDGHKFSVLCFSMWRDVAENVATVLDWPCETQKPRLFCYLMYTSGSTGKPKGVCGREIGLVNRFLWMQQLFPASRGDILLFKTSISFIDHLQEFLTAILSCTSLIIPPFDCWKADPFYLVDILKVYCISRLVTIPSLARAILSSYERSQWANVQKTLRLLVLSGEVLPLSLWNILHRLLPGTIMLNLYGSTEVSGDCMYFDCSHLPKILETEALNSVPIGVPISNCDVDLLQQGITGEGEICVGGSCLFVGYFDDLSDGFLSKDHTPSRFQTGDFAKRLQSGDLLFIGRKDRTIKVNGQRIALEEIEDVLREHPHVSDAAVLSESNNEPPGHIYHYLKAYIVLVEHDGTQGKQFPSFDKRGMNRCLAISIRSWLVRKLPPSMIPNYYSFIESLPKSSSGKVNYAILGSTSSISEHPMIEFDESQCSDHLQIIKQAFCDVLLIEEINDHDDFFSLGGSSISAALLTQKLGIDMRLLYRFPSPVRLLDALEGRKGPLNIAFHPDDLQTKRQKLDNSTEKVSAAQLKVHDNSGDSLHGIRSLRQLDSVNISDSNTATSGDHSLQLFKLNLPKLCSFSRCNNFIHGEGPEVDVAKKYCMTKGTPRGKTWDLKEIWKVPLESCVDASPLLVSKDDEFFLFIGSHSHIFLCVDAISGCVRWKTCLEGRVECSAATTSDFSHVVVGCYEGKIYILDFMSGNISWTFQTHGEVKMQPVAWKNLVWCGSHDHWLYALDCAKQCCVYKISCGGSPYGSPSIDMVRNMIYVASTSGRVTAISVESSSYRVAWLYEFNTPIFGSLSLDSSTGNVICCLVDGHVVALKSEGSLAWEAVTGGPVFAGACMSFSLPSQVVVCSRNGIVYSFESESGDLVWEYEVEDPITTSAYIDEHIQLVSEHSHVIHRLVCICSSSGSIRVVRIKSDAAQCTRQHAQDVEGNSLVEEVARMNLPGDIFSSPVMVGGLIFVGCRDDHVRCIKIMSDEFLTDSDHSQSLD